MTQNLEHSWVKEIYNESELKQYAEFESDLKTGKNAVDSKHFHKEWMLLVELVKDNLNNSPNSKEGISVGEKFMNWVNKVYGTKNANLRTKKWDEGFMQGKDLEDSGLSMEVVQWVDKAMDAY